MISNSPIFSETGVLPAPPTTILPIQMTGRGDCCFILIRLRIFVPNLNNKEKGYKEFDKYVSFFLYQNFGAFNKALSL